MKNMKAKRALPLVAFAVLVAVTPMSTTIRVVAQEPGNCYICHPFNLPLPEGGSRRQSICWDFNLGLRGWAVCSEVVGSTLCVTAMPCQEVRPPGGF